MVSRLKFIIDNDVSNVYSCEIHQDAGEDHNFDDTVLTIEMPDALRGRIRYDDLREAGEAYYRASVGAAGGGIRIIKGKGLRMYENRIAQRMDKKVRSVDDGGSGGWPQD